MSWTGFPCSDCETARQLVDYLLGRPIMTNGVRPAFGGPPLQRASCAGPDPLGEWRSLHVPVGCPSLAVAFVVVAGASRESIWWTTSIPS